MGFVQLFSKYQFVLYNNWIVPSMGYCFVTVLWTHLISLPGWKAQTKSQTTYFCNTKLFTFLMHPKQTKNPYFYLCRIKSITTIFRWKLQVSQWNRINIIIADEFPERFVLVSFVNFLQWKKKKTNNWLHLKKPEKARKSHSLKSIANNSFYLRNGAVFFLEWIQQNFSEMLDHLFQFELRFLNGSINVFLDWN